MARDLRTWPAHVTSRARDLQVLLKHGADIKQKDVNGDTVIEGPIRRCPPDLEFVKFLLAAGADPDVPNRHGTTPIMRVEGYKGARVVQELLAAGADPKAVDKKGGTTLMHHIHHPENFAVLVAAGADPNAKDNAGKDVPSRIYESPVMSQMTNMVLDICAGRLLPNKVLEMAAAAGKL